MLASPVAREPWSRRAVLACEGWELGWLKTAESCEMREPELSETAESGETALQPCFLCLMTPRPWMVQVLRPVPLDVHLPQAALFP